MAFNVTAPSGGYYRINCALVLEDEPVGDDSRLNFESFPEQIEEVYALVSYREIGADRMPQPSGVAYRGGNWSTFSLALNFRVGARPDAQQAARPPQDYDRERLEQELLEMELKARWCQALCFPLKRDLGEFGRGFVSRAGAFATQVTQALNNIKRNDPPKLLVVFGSWMVIRGYATNVSLKWEPPFDPVTNRPYGCLVNIQIQPLMVTYPTWQSIRGGAWSQQSRGTFAASGLARQDEQLRREERTRKALGEQSPDAGSAGTARIG